MLDWLRKTVVNGFIVNRNTLKKHKEKFLVKMYLVSLPTESLLK